MNQEKIELTHEKRITKLIDNIETIIQISIAFCLLLIAGALLIYTVYHTAHELMVGKDVIHTFIKAIQDILLVIIILEILWTVVNFIESHAIPLEPFLIIAIISSVRGLILQSTKTIEAPSHEIYHIAVEIGIHGLSIVLLVIALYILRKSRRYI
ncbi:conserved hypothetical protein [Thermosulfidibacter takaii ABI70S6]|uniref:Phosphate-starvation-inducible E-like protein n=1 Tax=Thermosulfidibacter takaii (strain DSM 17441 / JCM 13301 / NBRC 103674 / ABI70S6) TaxID=1298851 RepID=A0A0S3QUJ8_THET7|nr:phosphate-starvation-inducible PsiE family protein [Thermosulfidibacter takaii]BAT71975.1 conserved hypothetical protein [Thermosulfidibacter takaii ABI70S6]